jgi:ankyrin repeat protein
MPPEKTETPWEKIERIRKSLSELDLENATPKERKERIQWLQGVTKELSEQPQLTEKDIDALRERYGKHHSKKRQLWFVIRESVKSMRSLRASLPKQTHTDALQHALMNRDTATVRLALCRGADPNVQMGKCSSLFYALLTTERRPCPEAVQLLLEAGATVHLSEAVLLNSVERVQYLLDRGVSPEEECYFKQKPLCLAGRRGFLEIVNLLLERGASPNTQEENGYTPLLYAALHRRSAVVARLREAGATVGIVEAALLDEEALVLAFLEAGIAIDTRNSAGFTPLMAACAGGHLALAQRLLEQGADLRAQSKSGQTPARLAATHNHVPLLELLLQNGLDINQPILYGDEDDPKSATLLQAAILQPESIDAFRYLIAQGADIHQRMEQDTTPLWMACLIDNVEAARALLDAGADMYEEGGPLGSNPITMALHSRYGTETLKLFLERGMDLERRGLNRWTPLRLAVSGGHIEVAKILIEAGANVHEVDEKGETLMSLLLVKQDEAMAQLLKSHGVKPLPEANLLARLIMRWLSR